MFYADNFCTYTELGDPHRYVFKGKCIVTGKVVVPGGELFAYRHYNQPIQDAMPSVSASDREFLMSGHSQEGWDKVFPKGD